MRCFCRGASLQFSEAQGGLSGGLALERTCELLQSNQPSSSLSTDLSHKVSVLILPDTRALLCKESEREGDSWKKPCPEGSGMGSVGLILTMALPL